MFWLCLFSHVRPILHTYVTLKAFFQSVRQQVKFGETDHELKEQLKSAAVKTLGWASCCLYARMLSYNSQNDNI